MALTYTLQQLTDALEDIVGPELSKLLVNIQKEPGSKESPYLFLPSSADAELPPQDVARLIARTSNNYATACRIAGAARAAYKIAYGQYKFKQRISSGSGRNAAEREAKAAEASRSEYERTILLEAVVELAESIEDSTRVASESARRMLLGADQYGRAFGRVEAFGSTDDLKTW